MSKEIKFTEEEMKTVTEIQQSYLGVQNAFGQIGISRIKLEQQLTELTAGETQIKKRFDETQQKEKEFVDSIQKKYGNGNLDINSGVFTPTPVEETKEKTL